MSKWLTIAMPKWRIFKEAVALFQAGGYELPTDLEQSRKLIIDSPADRMRFILAKPVDVPTYVEHGVADVGIAGKDVLMEETKDVYEMLDLHISACYLAVAGLPTYDKEEDVTPKVATNFPHVASQYFKQRGEQVEIVKLNGSIELAPLIGLAQRIVDIVSTGQTLRDNGLVELEKIAPITSRLIVNPVSYRMKDEQIDKLVRRLQSAIERSDDS